MTTSGGKRKPANADVRTGFDEQRAQRGLIPALSLTAKALHLNATVPATLERSVGKGNFHYLVAV